MTCAQCGGPQRDGVVHVRRSVTLALYGAGVLLAYVLGGQILHDLAEGLDRTQLPLWKIAVPLVVLLGAVLASFVRLRRPICARCGAQGLFAPVGEKKTAEILSGAHTTRR